MYEENIGKACNDAFNRRSRTEIRPISIYLSPRPSPKLDDHVTKKRGRDENDPVPYNIYIYIYVYRIEYNRNRQTSHFLDAILFDSYTYTPFLASFFLLSFNRSFIQNAKSMNVIFGGSSDRPTHSSPFSRAMESPMRFSAFFFFFLPRDIGSEERCLRRDAVGSEGI